MSETDARPVRGGGLVAEATAIFDGTPAIAAAARATGPSFASGAEWMRVALGALRGETPRGAASFTTIGCVKYGLAVAAATVPLALATATRSAWPVLLVVPAFYTAEVQAVFAFPAALDGAAHPIATSRRIVRENGGTLRSMAIVIAIAAHMLGGGFVGRGFRRSWCVGCLAVLLWYERWRSAGPSDLALVPR